MDPNMLTNDADLNGKEAMQAINNHRFFKEQYHPMPSSRSLNGFYNQKNCSLLQENAR